MLAELCFYHITQVGKRNRGSGSATSLSRQESQIGSRGASVAPSYSGR